MKENVLVIFASGGGGLIQAAEAKCQEILAKNPRANIIKKDLMIEWVGIPFGYLGVKAWDYAQKKGAISKLEQILSCQSAADYFFWPNVFFRAVWLLLKENITQVIDTQPVCTAAIIKAIRFVNYYKKKNIQLEKVVVDLPTDLNTHFFSPIKKLSIKDRKLIKIFTIDPLLKDKETEEQFWERNCKLSLDRIYIQKYFIRQSFLKYQKKDTINTSTIIRASCYDKDEIIMTENVLKGKNVDFEKKDMDFFYKIGAVDLVYTILLGSQPAGEATIAYLNGFLRLFESSKKSSKHIIFIFCSKHNMQKKSLFKTVADFAIEKDCYRNLIIIPLSFQNEEVISPIFSRSNVTFTRSGGQTAMELMAVMRGKMFIHSEVKGDLSREKLLKGMYAWESGSALYLEEKKEATIVTPKTFEEYLSELF